MRPCALLPGTQASKRRLALHELRNQRRHATSRPDPADPEPWTLCGNEHESCAPLSRDVRPSTGPLRLFLSILFPWSTPTDLASIIGDHAMMRQCTRIVEMEKESALGYASATDAAGDPHISLSF